MSALFATEKGGPEASPFSILLRRVLKWQEKGIRILIGSHTSGQAERLRDLLSQYEVACRFERETGFRKALDEPGGKMTLLAGSLSSGFRNPEGRMGSFDRRRDLWRAKEIEREKVRSALSQGGAAFSSYQELHENDFIVHMDYGVGLYRGLKHLKIGGVANDYLLLEYLDGDKLYVPVDRLNLIQRYIGSDGGSLKLDRLGSQAWQKAKKKARAAASEMVKELLDLYAARQVFQGHSFPPVDQFYREFEATFEYEETPDQTKAIEEVMRDMGKSETHGSSDLRRRGIRKDGGGHPGHLSGGDEREAGGDPGSHHGPGPAALSDLS